MNVLVTGATGFIGNYVIDELLRQGHGVIATSSSAQKAERFSWSKNVIYIPFNFSDFNATINYYDFFKKPDLIIHLAWEGLPNYKEAFHLEINLPRQLAFLENLLQNGLKDITVTGTCFEYGMKEGCLTEEMACEPANAYAVAKNRLRRELQEISLRNPFHFKWVRLFYMFGKGQSPNSLFSLLDRALTNNETIFNMSGGMQERDYLPVELVAKNIVAIALQNKVTGVINCCSGKPIAVKNMVQDYLNKKGKSIILNLGYYPYPDYEPMRFWGDTTKLKSISGND
ncbi:MAG: NAD-dependent epimerase/dehydratase family protein [Chitinophagaceae bacterium]